MAIAIKDVLSGIPPSDFPGRVDAAYKPHAEGPPDWKFKLTRPFAGPIAASRLVARELLRRKDPDYFDFDGSPLAGFDSDTRFVISGRGGNMIAQILGDGEFEGKVASFRVGYPEKPVAANVAVTDLSLNLALAPESMMIDFDRRGRFERFIFRTPSLPLFQELVAPSFTGAEEGSRDSSQPFEARIQFGSGWRSLDLSWSQGRVVKQEAELLGQKLLDWTGSLRLHRDIVVGVMSHFGLPTRI